MLHTNCQIYKCIKYLIYGGFLFAKITSFSLFAQEDTTPVFWVERMESPSSEVIKALEKQSDWVVSYSSRLCLKDKIVFPEGSRSLVEHLNILFEDCRFDFIIKKNRIILKPKEKEEKIFVVSGFVLDAKSKERLPSANIYSPETYLGTISNNYGFYSLSLPLGTHLLRASYVGYSHSDILIEISKDTVLNFNLISSIQLQEVTIKGFLFPELKSFSGMGAYIIPIEDIKNRPALLGEVDLIKSIQLLPGIQGGSEGFTGIYVRGGGADQNLFMIDDVPVYNVGHLLGFFSIFNADAVNHVAVLKGAFPARYGGRLSSVIDVRMNEGNKEKIEGSVNLGLLSSGLSVNGPIKKDLAGFAISLRRTYFDLINALIQRNDEERANYYFYDINAKFNYAPNSRNHLYLSGYFGRDKYYTTFNYVDVTNDTGQRIETMNDENNAFWGNLAIALRWNYLISNKFFSNLTLSYSNYAFNVDILRHNRFNNLWNSLSQRYKSGIQDISIKLDFDYYHTNGNLSKFGGNIIYHYFDPRIDFTEGTSVSDGNYRFIEGEPIKGWENHFYYENEFNIGDKFNTNLGGRVIIFRSEKRYYYSLEPRLSTRYIISPKLNLRSSAGIMSQYIHMLNSSNISLPNDLWLPITDKIPPMRALQTTLGADYFLGQNNDYSINIDLYIKWLENIISYKETSSFFDNTTDWEDKMTSGKGVTYGAEFLLIKNTGKLTGMLGYTIAKATNTFKELNNGIPFPDRHDRRHDISINLNYRFNERWDAGAMWLFGSGLPVSLPSEKYFAPQLPFQDDKSITNHSVSISSINGSRMPAFHRLDLGINYCRKKKQTERLWGLGVINTYGRQNPFLIYYKSDNELNSQQRTWEQLSVFSYPIPYIKYSFKF